MNRRGRPLSIIFVRANSVRAGGAVGRGNGTATPGDLARLAMSSKSEPNLEQLERASARGARWARQNLVRILFVHRSVADVERCLYELKRVRFTVSSDVVLTPAQF